MNSEARAILNEGQEAFFDEPSDFVAATRCFERVIEMAPDWIEGHHWLAGCLERRGLHGKAVQSYRRAIECDPADARARIGFGRLLSELGHHKRAIAELKRGLALKPHYGEADARLFLAEAYQKIGNRRAAQRELTRVAALPGEYPSYDEPRKLARARSKLGE